MVTLSIVQSMMMIIPVVAFTVNQQQTLRGHMAAMKHSPTLRFIAFGGLMYTASSIQGSFEALRKRVREPLEDTQLAFYAALELQRADGAPAGPLQAMYLALDDSGGIQQAVHEDVASSARVLVEGLAQELRRLREGAPLPALGDGPVCEHCEVRGLCRRDHWAEPAEQPA